LRALGWVLAAWLVVVVVVVQRFGRTMIWAEVGVTTVVVLATEMVVVVVVVVVVWQV
jgi:hypothetical protein